MKRVIVNVPTNKLQSVCDDLKYESTNVCVVPNGSGFWNVYYLPK